MFLVEKILGIDVFRFEPWKFDPWSQELEELLKSLERKGLLKIRTEAPDLASWLLGEAPVKIYEASAELIATGEEAYKKLVGANPIKALYLKKTCFICSKHASNIPTSMHLLKVPRNDCEKHYTRQS